MWKGAAKRHGSASFEVTAVAAVALGLGAAVYLLARASATNWLPGGLGLMPAAHTAWLPSLFHALAFTLFGAAALGLSRRSLTRSATCWLLIGWSFEALQHPYLAIALVPLPHTPPPEGILSAAQGLLARHAHLGTFDPLDLLGTALGVAIAAMVGRRALLARSRP